LLGAADDNIYFTTRSGYLTRINVRTCQLEDLNLLLPNSCQEKNLQEAIYPVGVNGPDGRLYMAGAIS